MLEIDGSYGEGGGQIVRTGVSLSTAFNKPVRIINIRQGRRNPGLKAQHLWAIKALSELVNAKVTGLGLGSESITYQPGKWVKQEVEISIPTAGSIGLVIQCLLPALINAPYSITIKFRGGATCGKWSPPLDFLRKVLFPNLVNFGLKEPGVNIEREGYYPKGGAIVDLVTHPSKIRTIKALTHGKVQSIKARSHASKSLNQRRVAERQAKGIDAQIHYSDSLCTGSCLTVWAECEHSIIGADALGERGKPAEQVNKEALNKLDQELIGAFDSHTTDMLIPFMALAGNGEIKSSSITEHTKTNAWLCSQFTGKEFIINNKVIKY